MLCRQHSVSHLLPALQQLCRCRAVVKLPLVPSGCVSSRFLVTPTSPAVVKGPNIAVGVEQDLLSRFALLFLGQVVRALFCHPPVVLFCCLRSTMPQQRAPSVRKGACSSAPALNNAIIPQPLDPPTRVDVTNGCYYCTPPHFFFLFFRPPFSPLRVDDSGAATWR